MFLRFSTIHSRKTRNSTRNLILPRVKQPYQQQQQQQQHLFAIRQ